MFVNNFAEIKFRPSLKLNNGYLPKSQESIDFPLDHFAVSKLKYLETQPSKVGWETQYTSKLNVPCSPWFPKEENLFLAFKTVMESSVQAYNIPDRERAGQDVSESYTD